MYLFELVGFFFAVKCPGVELLSHMVVLFSVLWEISVLFSIEAAPVYIATRIYEGSLFSISLPTFVICGLFDISCSDRFEEISHYGFSLHFSDDKWYKACFYVPIGHLYVFFGKMPIQVVCPFFIWGLFFCFFLKFTFLFIYWFIDWLIAVLGLRFCARAFSSCGKQGPLFIVLRGPLTITASLVAEHRLQTHRLSNCGSRAQLLRGMWDLPRPGLEPVSPALAGRFSTTAPPGKPLGFVFLMLSWMSYLYILDINLIGHIICKYFLLFSSLSFYFVSGFLCCAKAFKFN